jgi:hypothetical protein
MEYTYDDLKHKTVADLRDIAKEIDHEAVKGYSQLNKEHLLAAICEALHIDMHVHHDVVGIDKKQLKVKIRKLKKDRDKALEAHDHAELKRLRKKIRMMKKNIKRAMV